MAVSVAAFYRFVQLPDFKNLRQSILDACVSNGLLGTILLAEEGINGTISGSREGLGEIRLFLSRDERLKSLPFRYSTATEAPFHRMKVKLRKEIVTLGVPEINPAEQAGEYIQASDWNAVISDPEVLLIDTRNKYETAIGSFEGAIDPNTTNFRDFPEWLEKQGYETNHKIAMFCTGGIRCEKSTAFLKSRGFQNVVHLKGGILDYLEKVPESQSKWAGECFVFDERVSVGHGLKPGEYVLCRGCRHPLTDEETLSEYYEEGVSCQHCFNHSSEKQKAGYRERQRQMDLAEERESEEQVVKSE